MKIIGIDEEEKTKKKVLNHKKIVITIVIAIITLALIYSTAFIWEIGNLENLQINIYL